MAKPVNEARGKRQPDLWSIAKHDFRQPSQSLELLSASIEAAGTAQARAACARQIRQLAASMRGMTEALSLLERIESGDQAPALTSVALDSAISDALGRLGARAGRAAVETSGHRVRADRQLLSVCLDAMVLYAVKYGDGSMHVCASARGNVIVVQVGFPGAHPRGSGAGIAFVELEPENAAAMPIVGLGPALLGRLADTLGWRLELSRGGDTAAVTLAVPKLRAG